MFLNDVFVKNLMHKVPVCPIKALKSLQCHLSRLPPNLDAVKAKLTFFRRFVISGYGF